MYLLVFRYFNGGPPDPIDYGHDVSIAIFNLFSQDAPGLEKSTCPLVFTSASGCRASETLDDFQCKLTFFPYMPIIFVMQGKCLFQDISRPVLL